MSLLEMPRPVQLAGDKRIHRLGKPDELEEDQPRATARPTSDLKPCPPLPPAAEETAMPRGVYPRKAKTDQPGAEAKALAPSKAAKRKKPKAGKVVARLASTSSSEPNFVVDDAGRIAIIDGTTRIDLSLPATKRLATFIERTKSFRA